jgi:DNA-binding beta-propeller fold protein YncE
MAKKNWRAGLALVALLAGAGMSPRVMGRAAAADGAVSTKVPVFEPDTSWPQLPNAWALGNVAKIVVDQHDNVWLIHRPRTVAAGKTAAPPVVEIDANGKFLQAWGGAGSGYDWPDAEHNVLVDYKDNVWISGSSPSGQSKTQDSDDMIIKFTNKGKFIMQIGGRSVSKGSTDPKSVNKPGDIFVFPKTNELYVADGYGNRRVIVFDADSGAFKRMWGAFGKPPLDDATSGGRGPSGGPLGAAGGGEGGRARGAAPALDTEGDGAPTFGSPVHSVVVSNDNIVYVGDRSNRRIQMFTPEGKYLGQVFINRAGPATGSVCGLAFSPDKDQQFLYVADYGNSHIVVLNRKTMEVLYQFGKRGDAPGDFQGVHHIAIDSKGNLYTGEVAPGGRAQRFAFKGMSSTLPPNALTAADLAPKPGI